jgi:hypothetical protein
MWIMCFRGDRLASLLSAKTFFNRFVQNVMGLNLGWKKKEYFDII